LVIALHGCTQTAEDYDRGTGWSSLADIHGFIVIYPQQQPSNNPKNCFSWFLPGDVTRGQGEAFSIREMVEYAIETFAADRRNVFVTGLSAGGAMASVMLATYPEVFAGGAIIAGLPYGSASNVEEAFHAMFTPPRQSTHALGNRVRAASGHRGAWPKISVWHGTGDPIVNPSNSEGIVRQWTNVHGLSDRPSHQELIGNHTRRVWSCSNGNTLVESFSISGMAHGVPLATTGESCGAAGAFFLDVGISSTHHIARFWGLQQSPAEMPCPAAALYPSHRGAFGVLGATPERAHVPAEAAVSEGEERETRFPLDPNAVISAAFKAAGLAPPDTPAVACGQAQGVAPGPIIAAALKSAGLVRS
jgi:feruloyl esterase